MERVKRYCTLYKGTPRLNSHCTLLLVCIMTLVHHGLEDSILRFQQRLRRIKLSDPSVIQDQHTIAIHD